MALRKGFLFGFLLGALAGSVAAKPRTAEAPQLSDTTPSSPEDSPAFIERLQRLTAAAMAAARDAANERERELQREFDEMRRSR